jgi:hypothetical protein
MPRGNKPRVSPAIEAALQKKGNLSDLDLAKMCFCVRRSAARILFDMQLRLVQCQASSASENTARK